MNFTIYGQKETFILLAAQRTAGNARVGALPCAKMVLFLFYYFFFNLICIIKIVQ